MSLISPKGYSSPSFILGGVKVEYEKKLVRVIKKTRDRTPMGRPVVMLTRKDKLTKRCNSKRQWKKEISNYG